MSEAVVMHRKLRWLWVLVPLAIVALLGVREAFDPFLILFLRDALFPGPQPHELMLNDRVAVRIYADTRPHIGKIAALQKGLVLVVDGKPVIEEGYGFGLPLVYDGNLVHNARHAEITAASSGKLVKHYTIDVADRWSRFLRVKYKNVAPLGSVVVTYTVETSTTLRVEVDFSALTADWQAAYVMNEQGADHFPIYEDSRGVRRHGDEIGIWRADGDPLGCWVSAEQDFRFCVETEDNRRRYVGRERYSQYNWVRIYKLAWSGIDLEIDPPVDRYTYLIHVEPVE